MSVRAAEEKARGLLRWQERRVREFIDANLSGSLRVKDLSAQIQRSASHFARSFKETFGETPHSYVARRRVHLASQLMLEADSPLRDIALMCGYSDQAHLCKQFRISFGMSPSEWRRARRSSGPPGAPAPP